MPANRTRQESRERLLSLFQKSLDRLIPEDESVPLKGRTFLDFEESAIEHGDPILAAIMEERAHLDQAAHIDQAERCPHCASDRVYLTDELHSREYQSTRGPIVIEEQRCRCRKCNRSFSPQKKVGAS